jgi:RNA polymerase sigma-32 factor
MRQEAEQTIFDYEETEEKVSSASYVGPGAAKTAIDIYGGEAVRYSIMTREEEFEIASRYRATKDPALANRLVTANLRFVMKIAFEYRHYGFDMLDLIQEGNIGLVKAVEKFDPDRGHRLLSYAVWWIRAGIQEYILTHWSLVKMGTTRFQRRLFSNLRSHGKAVQRRREALEAGVTEEEVLARITGGTVDEVIEMQNRMQRRDVYLGTPTGEDGTSTMIDMIPDGGSSPEELFEGEEVSAIQGMALKRAMKVLSDREGRIIRRRHLIEEPDTLQTLGDDFGMSKERVRQIEKRALSRIENELTEAGLRI